ncbi:MAG: DUF3810 domain-containing protein [Oscillospiraceae bacterium]|jgi:hypothetical protein|nr:DUF3810 domain-containing protein [Oscillospiraceae bacterium]
MAGERHRRRTALKYIIPAALAAAPAGIFYLTRRHTGFMDAVNDNAAAPARAFLGRLSSALPFMSLAEVVCTAAALWVLYHIIKTVMRAVRRRGWRTILARRAYALALAALLCWTAFCWLWGVGYFASGFAVKSGLLPDGVTADRLAEATRIFADMANSGAGAVRRDDGGHFDEPVGDIIALSDGVYDAITREFPALAGSQYRPKAMLYSRVFSRLGFTGFYFAFTGESNINTAAPGCLIPATAAHELAHQRGVFAEEEANFAGIAACVTSGIPVYEYSGALSGLMYLSSALRQADADAWTQITSGLNDDVRRDWEDNNAYWEAQRSDTGAGAVVNAIYDGYLKSNGQPLGVKSYGACVDLLVEWVHSGGITP